jgi:hypothetical protein
MRFETSSDGSLIILVDRDPRSKRGSMSGTLNLLFSEQSVFTPIAVQDDGPLPSSRFSVHTTGVIHRYADGARKSTIQIEPLYALTKLAGVGIVSIPRIARLDTFEDSKHCHDVQATLEFPENASERMTFVIELGPKPQEPQSFGIGLNYELYSVVVRVIPNLNLPIEVSEHFIAAMGDAGVNGKIDKATAELEFYQRIHGPNAFVFREDGGSYLAMSVVPMATPPKLAIAFSRLDLRIEVVPFGGVGEPTHKVRFWICDRGGRNKIEDLRPHISSVELDSRL